MNTELDETSNNLDVLSENLGRVEELSQRLVAALANKRDLKPALQAPGQDFFSMTAAAYWGEVMANPGKLIEQQVGYWGKSVSHFVEAQKLLAEGKVETPDDPGPSDPRFSNPLWDSHPYFNLVKQQYLTSSEAITNALSDLEGLEDKDQQRVEYFTRQIVDMFSPANFLGTNPEALTHAVETNGQSLVDGLENLVSDIEANNGDLIVRLADENAFEVGGNIATTEGSVVFRNRMFELIQYAPTTETVKKTPLLIFPPWINKYYIMDLKPKNSLIKWIVDQGYTLFVVSWINPDASYGDVNLDTYITEGYLTAIDQVKSITDEKKINVVGYCIAGTTLSLTMALNEKRGDKSINSATLFTTLTDFEDPGELGVFLTDDFVDGIEEECREKGILESFIMGRTFSFLRSNDLVYGPAIRSYMMGKTPPAFDLLYWNGDGSNLPGAMTTQYLRQLCTGNYFAKDGIEICGETLRIKDIKTPIFSVACETDHIAGWKSCFDGVKAMSSRSKTFVVSESGHIAGIINPPSKKKYGHYTNDAKMQDADDWLETATKTEGSWWPRWNDWLSKKSGKSVPARHPGENGVKILAAAPGTYVIEKSPK